MNARPNRAIAVAVVPGRPWNPPWTETPQAPQGIRLPRVSRAVDRFPFAAPRPIEAQRPVQARRSARASSDPAAITTSTPKRDDESLRVQEHPAEADAAKPPGPGHRGASAAIGCTG